VHPSDAEVDDFDLSHLAARQKEVLRLEVAVHQAALVRGGEGAGHPRAEVETQAAQRLVEAGFEPDYAVVRRPDFTEPNDGETGSMVALVAAKLGNTRLIDNREFDI